MKLTYAPSPKHCEPITAERPGTICPMFSVAVAQALLDASVPMDGKRVATRNGIAFVAQDSNDGTWHGYPEAWEKVARSISQAWLDSRAITRRDMRRWWTREKVRHAWRELRDVE